jgi:hypothetical protein
MPRDNRAGSSSRCSAAREPILSRCALRGKSHRTIDPHASKNPRPAGAESTLTENASSPFHAEPRQHAAEYPSGEENRARQVRHKARRKAERFLADALIEYVSLRKEDK